MNNGVVRGVLTLTDDLISFLGAASPRFSR